MATFRIRNFLCEYSMLPPTEYCLKNGRRVDSERVPVISMFGATDTGVKACVHIHGVLPYIVLRVGGELTDRVQELMCAKLNKLLHLELHRKQGQREISENERIPNYVHHLESFQAKSLYGYHSQLETFAKVFLTDPFHILKLTSVLGQLAEEKPIMQPFEAHVPFILQFFIDYSIFGMDWVNFRCVKFRVLANRADNEILYKRITIKKLHRRPDMVSYIPPSTSCSLEIDVAAHDILNNELHSTYSHSSNPGLEYIWVEEAERCRLQNRPLEDIFNQYPLRPYPKLRSETVFLEKLQQVVTKLQEESNVEQLEAEAQESPKIDNAETIWSQALHNNDETGRAWRDTQDVIDYGLNEDCNFQPREEEEEYDNIEEMNMLVDEAGLQKEIDTETDDGQRISSVLETTVLDSRRDTITPTLPEEQVGGTWYRSRKKLPLVKRTIEPKEIVEKIASPAPPVAPTPEPPNVQIHATLRNKMLFVDDSAPSSRPRSNPSPDAISPMDGVVDEVQCFCAASLELFIYTEHRTPNAISDPILAASLCVNENACLVDAPQYHKIITTSNRKLNIPKNILQVPQEVHIFEQILAIIARFDPDILIGYDADRLSWTYLMRRAEALGVLDFPQRLGHKNKWKKDARITSTVDGRLMESVWRCVRRDLNLRAYDRPTACAEILKEKVAELNDCALSRRFLYKNCKIGRSVYQYLSVITFINISILKTMDWFIRNCEMARVYGIQFHEVWTRGSQLRVESMLLRLAHKFQFVAPSVTVEQRDKMCAPEQLQLIMEPESKVYHDPVIVLDFQSLYPSMVVAYNYCFSTSFGKIPKLTAAADLGANYIEFGAIKYAVEKKSLIESVADAKIHSSPLSAAFVHFSNREGILRILLKEVLGARILVKTSMKHTECKRLLRILDARQLALKLVANVTYGYTAANWSGRMPCVEVADAILAKGRETLERAIAMVNEGEYGGARVIYGDTDSMFVLVKANIIIFSGASLADAFKIGRKIASDVTADNPAPVVLKLEKVYSGCVLETKKRYAGWMYESVDSTPRLDSKGIETVRRDTCLAVAQTLEKCLEYILQQKYNNFLSFLDTRLTNLKLAHFTDFVFCKEYRGEYDENSPVPQKKVTEYYQSLSPGYCPLRGERIPYLVVVGEPDSTVISCVRSIDEFLEDEDLQINASYYVRAHILAALHRVTDLIPLNIDYLDETTFDCFNIHCRATGGKPWCRACAVIPDEAYLYSSLCLGKEQRIMENCKSACSECLDSCDVDIEECTNYQCEINKLITTISRSITPVAFLYHRIHKFEKYREDSEPCASTSMIDVSGVRTMHLENNTDEITDELSDYFEGMENVEKQDNEFDEEVHDRTYFHFTNIDENTLL